MANPEHLAKFLAGADAWNAWRPREPGVRPDLRGAVLRRLDLSRRDLQWIDFSGADLQEVYLEDCVVFSVLACRANWRGAKIYGTTFQYVNAEDCIFDDCALIRSTFQHCLLSRASFRGTYLNDSIFANTELRDVQGWREELPITIGIDTFFRSGGLPDHFLRAAKIPEEFITYARSLTGIGIEYYSCFISYSNKDDEFARRLHGDLQARKIKTWFAPEDLKIGDRFHSRIDDSIRLHDKLVLILSKQSIDSAWVRREVEAAREREDREKKDILFPIRLDDAIFESNEAWAAEIRRSKYIGDFRRWKSDDDYTVALDRLVKDLKKEGPIIMG